MSTTMDFIKDANNRIINSLENLPKAINYDFKDNARYVVHTANGGLHLYYKRRLDATKLTTKLSQFSGIDFKTESWLCCYGWLYVIKWQRI